MDIVGAKVLVMVLTSVIPILLSLLPLWFKGYLIPDKSSSPWRAVITSMLLCFGGGVLLATSLVHLLPEIAESLEVLETGIEPLAEILLCCGFFLVYFVEDLVYICLGTNNTDSTEEIVMTDFKSNGRETPRLSISKASDVKKHLDSHRDSQPKVATISNGGGHGHSHGINMGPDSSTSIRDFLAVLALSFHAVFEGLAVGLEEHVDDVWTLFAAVATHKYVISFCMGVELVSVGTPLAFFLVYILTFALMTPLGIGIGLAVSELASDENHKGYVAASGTLQALAAGSIIYVVCFEIMQRERAKAIKPKIVQFLAMVAGFAAMMTIDLTLHHEHGAEEEGDHDHGF